MRRHDPLTPTLRGMDHDDSGEAVVPAAPLPSVATADLGLLTAAGPVEQRLAELTPQQRSQVRAVLAADDLARLDPGEVIDLCDRISGYITFAEYQARRRAQRRAAKRA